MRVLTERGGDGLIQAALDIQHGTPGRETRAIGDAEDMRIHGNRRLAEGDVENHIGGLSSDTRQGFERFPGIRHLAVVVFD